MDSPLNTEGIEQAYELSKFLELKIQPGASDRVKDLIEIIRGNLGTSIIVSSSLRRAISTTTVSLWPRLQKNHEKIHILSSLQEMSRNIDTQSLSQVNKIADLPFSRLNKFCTNSNGTPFDPTAVYDLNEFNGNKTRSFYGIKRLKSFNEWVFKRSESTIIVGGHSLWFKNYFLTYMPHDSEHDCKKKKITNSGVVAFTIFRSEDESGLPLYRIEPASIEVVYGGFTTK